MAPRPVFVTTLTAMMTIDMAQRDYEAAPNLTPLAGMPIRLERPPA